MHERCLQRSGESANHEANRRSGRALPPKTHYPQRCVIAQLSCFLHFVPGFGFFARSSWPPRSSLGAVSVFRANPIDIKPDNILLDKNLNVKITDFGLSNWLKPGARLATFCGSTQYCSPEILEKTKYLGPEVSVYLPSFLPFVRFFLLFFLPRVT